MARLVKALSVSAGVVWLGSIGLVVMRATEALEAWATTAAVVAVGAATTLTMAAVFVASIPGMLEAWHDGMAYGRRLEREERDDPGPVRRHLTPVR